MSRDTGSRTNRLATVRDRLSVDASRRTFLRTVAGAGYGLAMAHLLDVEAFLAVEDGEVPVVTALVHEDPADPWTLTERTTAVPADWYARVSKAFAYHERIARAQITGYLGSAVRPGSYDRAGARIGVQVRADDLDRTVAVIRDALEDVAFDVEPVEEETGDDGPIGDLEGEALVAGPVVAEELEDGRVPGGVRCDTDEGFASLAPALYHPGTDRAYFATASHAYYDERPTGRSLYLPLADGRRLELGVVTREHEVADVVAAEPTGSVRPASAIQGAERPRVTGHLTKFGLADLAARGEPLEKMGAMTGHSSGEIHGIDAITCFTGEHCRPGQVQWGAERDLTDGDSGSVAYAPDPERDDGVLIAGFNNARTWWPGQSYVWGVAAYHLHAEHGYHF